MDMIFPFNELFLILDIEYASIKIPGMSQNKKINICSPGYNASCALCCGSHNYDASFEEISEIFEKRTESVYKHRSSNAAQGAFIDEDYCTLLHGVSEFTLLKVHDDAIQCPFVGYIRSTATIGCLIYPESISTDLRKKRLTGNTCRHFSCAAREVLTDDEIVFAARMMQDWYYYSLLINDIAFLKKIYQELRDKEELPDDVLKGIKENLTNALFEHALIGR
jgi:hypothetical protein